MIERIVVLGLIVITGACDPFYEVDVRFSVTNKSHDEIGLKVNGIEAGGIIRPGGSSPTVVEVPIALRRGSTTSVVDEDTRVEVVIYNFRTNQPTKPVFCRAGAKIVVSVFYEVTGSPPNDRENLDCRSLY